MTSHGATNVTEANQAVDEANDLRDAEAIVLATYLDHGTTKVGLDWYGDYAADYDTDAVDADFRAALEEKVRELVPSASTQGDELWCALGDKPLVNALNAQSEKDGESWIRTLVEDIDISALAAANPAKPTVVNLTPHVVTVVGGELPGTYAPAGTVARIETSADEGSDGTITVVYSTVITGLPDPAPRTIYIVSTMTAMVVAATGRDDLRSPYREVRDGAGRITGCKDLVKVRIA